MRHQEQVDKNIRRIVANRKIQAQSKEWIYEGRGKGAFPLEGFFPKNLT